MNDAGQNNNKFQIISVLIIFLLISMVTSKSVSLSYGLSSNGFIYASDDCKSGVTESFSYHPNKEEGYYDAAAYIQAYDWKLVSCDNSESGSGSNDIQTHSNITNTESTNPSENNTGINTTANETSISQQSNSGDTGTDTSGINSNDVNQGDTTSNGDTTFNDQTPTQQPNNDISSTESNSNGIDFVSICNTLQIALYHSCDELVNSDGSLTILGQATVKCVLSGAAMGGIASLILPPSIVIGGLSALAGPTGCGGLVKIDQLSSIGNINGILDKLKRFVP